MITRSPNYSACCVVRWSGFRLTLGLGGLVGGLEVHGRHLAAAVLLKLVVHPLVLAQRAQPRALDRADVDEGVIAAAVRRDEAVALALVEEFHRSGGHFTFPSLGGPKETGRFVLGEAEKEIGAAKRLKTVNLRLIAS